MTGEFTQIASFLKGARQKRNLTQKEVSSHFKYSTPQFVSNWERGVIPPPISTCLELSDLYDVDEREIKRKWLAEQDAKWDRVAEERRIQLKRK